MVTLDEALQIVWENCDRLETESVSLVDSVGMVLAQDVFSDVNVPPFNKSAMDGFACRKADLPGPLNVLETIAAGQLPAIPVEAGSCSRIMTGAAVPDGADTVIMIEHTQTDKQGRVLFLKDKSRSNICEVGEDIRIGSKVLSCGTLLTPAHIAVLAGAGLNEVLVVRRPKVAVMPTGSELVEPSDFPEKGKIRNSNGPQMVTQLRQMGFSVEYLGIVKDSALETRSAIEQAFEHKDVLIVSGGVSVGDFDLVPQILVDMGFELLTTVVATKPGKHTLFAKKGTKYVLGLPGNPVSSFVQLEVVGRALLFGLMGYRWQPLRLPVELGEAFSRKKGERFELKPVVLTEDGQVMQFDYHGSAHIHALTMANALLEIPLGKTEFKKGERAYARPI